MARAEGSIVCYISHYNKREEDSMLKAQDDHHYFAIEQIKAEQNSAVSKLKEDLYYLNTG
eukprot:5043941-Ditylum_brightwellii.AAC.1